jgi:hypothetical protein
MRPPESRAVVLKQPRSREQFVLHGPFKGSELALELVFEKDEPRHLYSLQAMRVNVLRWVASGQFRSVAAPTPDPSPRAFGAGEGNPAASAC